MLKERGKSLEIFTIIYLVQMYTYPHKQYDVDMFDILSVIVYLNDFP